MATEHRRLQCPPAGSGGFTLLELLVAISILAMVAVLGWRGLDAMLLARATLTGDLEQTHGMQLTFAQLQNDCQQLASHRLLGNRPLLLVQDGRLLLVRSVLGEQMPTRLQVVDYRLRDGRLTRWESGKTRNLEEFDNMWKSLTADADHDLDDGQAVLLQEQVNGMQISYWQSNGSGWHVAAAGDTENAGTDNAPAKWRGLQMALQPALHGHGESGSVSKTFLLGDV